MVEIQCPHCEGDIELEDEASGLFDCPHCDNEFSFGDDMSTEIPPFHHEGLKLLSLLW